MFPYLYLPVMEESNRRVLEPWRTYIPTPEWFRYKKRVRQLDTYIIGLLQLRWAQRLSGEHKPAASKDIVDRVMDAIPEGEWGAAAQRQLCYEIKTFVLAGHETSASMLTFALYELTQNKTHLNKVREEATRVFGEDEQTTPSRDALDSMDYTVGVLKETLRLYSVVPVVTRVAVDKDTLGGYSIPAGTGIIICMQGVHHHPAVWKQPSEFDPVRFVPPVETDNPYAFLPFIQGPRNCLGQHLALLEARVVLALLAKRFDLTAVRKCVKDPHLVPIGPAQGLELLVH